jgi:hypothetical protein
MRERQLEANQLSEYLIRDIKPTVMPPLNEPAEVTRIDEVIKPDDEAKNNENCGEPPFDYNECPED